jgi:hypothetical protein
MATDPQRATPARPSISLVIPWDLLVPDPPADQGDTPSGVDRRPGAVALHHLARVAAQRGDPVASDLTADTLRRLCCDADVSRIITGPAGEILDVGRSARTATPAQRRALVVRDRGCVFPGCDRPPGYCQAHHLQPWEANGPTDLDNLVLACSHHHHALHDRGFTMTRAPDATLTTRRPDGTPIT